MTSGSDGDNGLAAPVPIAAAGGRFDPEERADLILVYGVLDPTLALYFDGLPLAHRQRLRFLRPSLPQADLPHLAAASLVIVAGGMDFVKAHGLLAAFAAMKLPFACFREDVSPAAKGARRHVRGSKTILASCGWDELPSRAHGSVLFWPPIFDETLVAGLDARRQGDDGLRLVVPPGSEAWQRMPDRILPAMAALGTDWQITARPAGALGLPAERTDVLPYALSFRQFVDRMQRRQGGSMLCSDPGGVRPATLLAACYIGAVPVVTAQAAVSLPGALASVAVLVEDDSVKAWTNALRPLPNNERRRRLAALDGWCRERFSPAEGAISFATLDRWSRTARGLDTARRLDLAHRLAERMSRNLPLEKALAGPQPLPFAERVPYVIDRHWRQLCAKLRGTHPFIPR